MDYAICGKLLNDDELVCEKCGAACHMHCMSQSSSDICSACVANENQINSHNTSMHSQCSQRQTIQHVLNNSQIKDNNMHLPDMSPTINRLQLVVLLL